MCVSDYKCHSIIIHHIILHYTTSHYKLLGQSEPGMFIRYTYITVKMVQHDTVRWITNNEESGSWFFCHRINHAVLTYHSRIVFQSLFISAKYCNCLHTYFRTVLYCHHVHHCTRHDTTHFISYHIRPFFASSISSNYFISDSPSSFCTQNMTQHTESYNIHTLLRIYIHNHLGPNCFKRPTNWLTVYHTLFVIFYNLSIEFFKRFYIISASIKRWFQHRFNWLRGRFVRRTFY